jgi:crossover junction endodeoxyribonuclease RusA
MKALLDSLGHAGAFIDDSQIDRLHIERRDPVAGGEAAVRVTEIG